MKLPAVNINVLNNQLGSVTPIEDGTAGLVVSAESSKLPTGIGLNEPKLIFSLKDAEELGIDEAYDKDNEVSAYFHIKEFYEQAGTGAKLWITLASRETTMGEIADKSIANGVAKTLLETANGDIKIMAITRNPNDAYSPSYNSGLDDDVSAAVLKAHELAQEFAGTSNNGTGTPTGEYRPVRILIEGRDYQGQVSNLNNLREGTQNRVAVILGSTTNTRPIKNSDDEVAYKGASAGLALGKLAKIPVQRNIGRVKDGDLSIVKASLSNGELIEEIDIAEQGAIHDKGYIFMRTYQGKAGFYFTDDPAATEITDDYSSIARGRVVDKAIAIAYNTYVSELLDEVQVSEDGTLNPALIKSYQANIETAIASLMVAEGEVSDVEAEIDPNQNVLSNDKIQIKLLITPVGYAKTIEVNLGFNNPALTS